MGLNLDGPIYLQRRGYLSREKNRILDIGPQNVYFAREEQVMEFLTNQGSKIEGLTDEIARLIYFSTPRSEERTTLFSEITDLTNIEYNSIDVCPGLKTEILDLNFDSLPISMRGYFDIVLNFGTTEHIFNQWNCFEVIHDAAKVGGIIYHQLPASGYFDHGYFCYTPLFFREMATANGYEILDLFVTPAGESKIDELKLPASSSHSIFETLETLDEDNRIPALNIHVIMKRMNAQGFRCALEIATAHAPANHKMLSRYEAGAKQTAPLGHLVNEVKRLEGELAATKNSTSWRVTKPLRDIADYLSRDRRHSQSIVD
jgi:SAM-dependent methyltransferase